MAVTTAVFWVSLVLTIVGLNASGEISILHTPKSLVFTGSSIVPESTLKEIFSAALGLSVEESSNWNGLHIADPFSTPEAVVEVYVDGVSSLGDVDGLESKNFPLKEDQFKPDTYDELKHRIMQRFPSGHNRLVNIKLSDTNELTDDVFGTIKVSKKPKLSLQHLKLSTEEDLQFLRELEALNAITEKVKSSLVSGDIDFYFFRFVSLHALSDYHGPKSLQTKEAKKLLCEALEQMKNAFVKVYNKSVLVTVVTTNIEHTRRARAVETPSDHGADDYSADYAAIFNIILWFGVVFAFSLVAIIYALADMDPGRDSIIYRMTSTRMKKDN